MTEEHKRKLSEAKKGSKHPLFGKHHSEASKIKMSQSHLGKSSGMKGKKHSQATKNKIRITKTGKKHTEESKKKTSLTLKGRRLSIGMLGHHHSKETKKKMSLAQKGEKSVNWGRKYTKAEIRNFLYRRPMSSLETKFDGIVKKYNLPYKFVGNGKFFIERKNPDFININGEKKAIEVYYRKHKEFFGKKSVEAYKQERVAIFSKYGWETLFFDETQVNDENVLKVLKGGY
jgi:NUMOD3 motif